MEALEDLRIYVENTHVLVHSPKPCELMAFTSKLKRAGRIFAMLWLGEHLLSGVFGMTGSSDFKGLLMPNWFSAETRKWYSTFSLRPFTTRDVPRTLESMVYQAALGTSRLSRM